MAGRKKEKKRKKKNSGPPEPRLRKWSWMNRRIIAGESSLYSTRIHFQLVKKTFHDSSVCVIEINGPAKIADRGEGGANVRPIPVSPHDERSSRPSLAGPAA
jgi:hypothetical protein